jgi:hypothetical protein
VACARRLARLKRQRRCHDNTAAFLATNDSRKALRGSLALGGSFGDQLFDC